MAVPDALGRVQMGVQMGVHTNLGRVGRAFLVNGARVTVVCQP